jgi:excisionase family DNA binding protein
MEDTFLTVAEIASLLKLNQQTVRNWIDAGKLPAVRVGRRVRVRQSEFEQFIAAGETAAAREPQDASPGDDQTAELRERVSIAIADANAALEQDDDRLASSLDLLIEAARGLTEALKNRSSG